MKTTDHSFKIEDAKKYGVECAVLLYNLRHWLEKNVANEKHIHEGRVWTYNSTKAFADLFPYLSEKQIYRRLQKLEKEGILLTGNYNNHDYDRTKWYSIDETEYSISHNRENHSPKSENGNSESGETIPDINTDINTDSIYSAKIIQVVSDIDQIENKNVVLACHLWHDVDSLQPNNKTTQRAKVKTWAEPIRLMVEQDDRTYEEIWDLWKRVQKDEFWRTNILSPAKLREKFDQLSIKLKPQKPQIDEQFIDSLF